MSNGNALLTKISGYLEKKGKLRIGSLWKKYWFVLEGRLLLYYRSKDEYEAISPCKGSINLCPPCTIKPAAATSCVFQIECRSTTRAESRAEQERWMQALLTSIDQSKSSPNRMSHFRYSLDDLPTPIRENKSPDLGLQRQNTLPSNTSSPKKDIIGRLQLIGAHTYGGSLNTITKLTPKVQAVESSGSSEHEFLIESNSPQYNSDEVIVENDQYSIIQEENSLEVFLDEQNSKTVSLEQPTDIKNEQTPTCIIENDEYCHSNDVTKTEETNIRSKLMNKSEPLYERISTDSTINEDEPSRKNSNIYERISKCSTNSEAQATVCDQYSIVKKKSQESLKSQKEPEYSIPVNLEDYNKNSLIIDNEQYVQQLDNEYYKVDSTKELEELYEDPDVLHRVIDVEPLLPPRPDIKKYESSEESCSQSSVGECKIKRRRGLQILAQLIRFDRKDDLNKTSTKTKKKRSTSFIHKMLRRKAKSVDSADDFEYDVIDYNTIEKPKDINDVQMLHELQKILETRKTILQKKLNPDDTKNESDIWNNTQIEEVNNEDMGTTQTVEVIIEERPSLPPRQSFHALLDNNQLTNLTNTLNSTINNTDNKIRTIDEIIEDLDKEKDIQESKNKVKVLIEKFNDLQNEDEVLLRKKLKGLQRSESEDVVLHTFFKLSTHEDTSREYDELTKLLEELSKVTSAPVLTPGVTCSLTTPIITDDEWLQLIPIRHRRLSDPDYDVPRPHRSLQLQHFPKQVPENAIPATRFFGPVLPANDKLSQEGQSLSSMDPDSLEMEQCPKNLITESKFVVKHSEKDSSIASYSSHNYAKTDEVIYLQPKSILVNMKMNLQNESHCEDDLNITFQQAPVIEETFIDSLEPVAQSTAF